MNRKIDDKSFVVTGQKYLQSVIDDLNNANSSLNRYINLQLIDAIPNFPKNSSRTTRAEILYINRCQREATDSEILFTQKVHDLDNNYKLWSIVAKKLCNLSLDKEFFNQITNQTEGLINYVKLCFARLRPFQLAPQIDIKLDRLVDNRYTTASYPSGHSCEAYLFANILGDMQPKKRKMIFDIAEKISHSRLIAGVHYPSDLMAGRFLAYQIFSNNLCNYKKI